MFQARLTAVGHGVQQLRCRRWPLNWRHIRRVQTIPRSGLSWPIIWLSQRVGAVWCWDKPRILPPRLLTSRLIWRRLPVCRAAKPGRCSIGRRPWGLGWQKLILHLLGAMPTRWVSLFKSRMIYWMSRVTPVKPASGCKKTALPVRQLLYRCSV